MKGDAAAMRSPGSEESAKENKEHKQVESSASSVPAAAAPAAGNPPVVAAASAAAAAAVASTTARPRQPFTQLSQIESDLVLARTLQEQERAYMFLRTNGSGLYEYDDSEEDDEEDNRVQAPAANPTIDGSQYESDEAFARALQENEEREHAARMMALAGIHDLEDGEDEDEEEEDDEEGEEVEGDENLDEDDDLGGEEEDEEEEDVDEDGSDESQDWQDVDPDQMSYEELVALGDAVGVQSRGLSADAIAELPVTSYKRGHVGGSTSSDSEQCVICRHEYEEDEMLLTLPCKHKYHSECIQQWLQINKVCPVCSAGVTAS